MQREALDAHAARGGGPDQRGLVDSVGQRHELEQAGRRAGGLGLGCAGKPALGQVAGERLQQRLAPALVARAHAAHVAVELAAHDEVAQRQLPHHLRAAVLDGLGGGDLPRQPRGRQHPAEAHARRQALAGGADVEHALGREPLQRADRDAVVAVLGVVVVLDDQPLLALGPLDQRGAPRGAEHRAGGELVGGRHHHHGGVAGDQLGTRSPSRVDRDRHDRRPACSAISRCTCQPGSSSAIDSTPWPRSTAQASEKPCMKPVQIIICSVSAAAPRTRPR